MLLLEITLVDMTECKWADRGAMASKWLAGSQVVFTTGGGGTVSTAQVFPG